MEIRKSGNQEILLKSFLEIQDFLEFPGIPGIPEFIFGIPMNWESFLQLKVGVVRATVTIFFSIRYHGLITNGILFCTLRFPLACGFPKR